MNANAIHRCPQCGDPTYLKGWPCDGCWFESDLDPEERIDLSLVPGEVEGLLPGPWDDPRPGHVDG